MSEDAPEGQRPGAAGVLIGRPLGIPIYVAPSWFLIAAVLTIVIAPNIPDRFQLSTAAEYGVAAGFVILLYASVLIHELAHSIVARVLRLPVRRITLMLLGGVSELEREPETADREYLVAFAGPVMSLLLSSSGFALAAAFPDDSLGRLIVGEVAITNLLVAVFNLLPGLPLDGGRVLRSIVWGVSKNANTGTVVAAWCGRVLAVLVGIAPFVAYTALPEDDRPSVFNVFFFGLLGWFLWAGASQSLRLVELRRRLPRIGARELARRALTVPADLPLAEALRRAQEAGALGLVTVDADGRPSGLVSEAAVGATPEQRRPWVTVGTLARRLEPALVLDAELRGQAVLDAIAKTPASEYLVIDGPTGMVWGVLATSDVARVVNTG
jgi:Zn-dependent protease/CBS domain-containing protein